jgi:hypothetical protein
MQELSVWRHSCGLHRTRAALSRKSLTLGFIGGSITDPRTGHNWPEAVVAWFVEAFPDVRIVVENAAIGATGSDLAVFRAERDLIARGCDLVFVEFAVNDNGEPAEKRGRTREGLLRKLLAGEGSDVVLAYTFCQDMYADMQAGRVPPSIADFEALGRHYGVGSVWMGLYALEEVMLGRMRWEEWLPDGLHPQTRGSLSYAQSVIAYLEKEIHMECPAAAIPSGAKLPAPLDPGNWEFAHLLPWSAVTYQGPWTLRRATTLVWMEQVLVTSAPGASLTIPFEGRGLVLGFDFGRLSSEFRYRVDGGPWQDAQRERPGWCGNEGWYRVWTLGDALPAGAHCFELQVTHGGTADCGGTNCRLALVGVIP